MTGQPLLLYQTHEPNLVSCEREARHHNAHARARFPRLRTAFKTDKNMYQINRNCVCVAP